MRTKPKYKHLLIVGHPEGCDPETAVFSDVTELQAIDRFNRGVKSDYGTEDLEIYIDLVITSETPMEILP